MAGQYPKWAKENLIEHCVVQGNLDPLSLIGGGDGMLNATRQILAGPADGQAYFQSRPRYPQGNAARNTSVTWCHLSAKFDGTGKSMSYEWVKVMHLLAVISWMAGLLYLPRLMVYHVDAAKDGELSETLKVMERRLLKAIMTPAMIVSWIFGIWLGAMQGLWSELPLWFLLQAGVGTGNVGDRAFLACRPGQAVSQRMQQHQVSESIFGWSMKFRRC